MKIKSNPNLTILTIVFGLLIINLFLNKVEFLYSCITLCAIAIFSKYLAKLIENIWFKLSYFLSLIVPNILLTVVFFFILSPLALISKISKKKSYFTNNKISNFELKNKKFDKKSFDQAW